ncbi:MAG TPA: hypothetical protein VMD47_02770 [Candidatus Acidoferrales bacterium]|nr:hypothetical protein [Candidatus Acidoferrales bacterium]
MKPLSLAAIALGVAAATVPLCASAVTSGPSVSSQTGAICGYLDASPTTIAQLQILPVPENIIIARSTTDVVSSYVQTDGSFCFGRLTPGIYTITAFGDSPAQYQATVSAVAGKTSFIEVTRHQD